MSVLIHPSILSADFVNVEAEIARIASADGVHCDVMDNHFVPALTFGTQMVKRIVEISPVRVDVHLMISDADRHAPGYAELGADSVTFHVEASTHPEATVAAIHAAGAKAAIAIKPGTPIEPYLDMLHLVDMVLIMTVEPGAGGQAFMSAMMTKVDTAVAYIAQHNLEVVVQVDGGITRETLPLAHTHGATCFVAGSSVFGHGDPAHNIAALRAVATPERTAS